MINREKQLVYVYTEKSLTHEKKPLFQGFFSYMASTKGLEPLTVRLEGACSIQLSYVDTLNCLTIIAESSPHFNRFPVFSPSLRMQTPSGTIENKTACMPTYLTVRITKKSAGKLTSAKKTAFRFGRRRQKDDLRIHLLLFQR